MFCEIGRGGQGEGEEAAYPAGELGHVVIVEAPGYIDDLLR